MRADRRCSRLWCSFYDPGRKLERNETPGCVDLAERCDSRRGLSCHDPDRIALETEHHTADTKNSLPRHGWPQMEEILSWDALYVPQTFNGFSTFFGVAAFSYGATIIIPEIQASNPESRCGSFALGKQLLFQASPGPPFPTLSRVSRACIFLRRRSSGWWLHDHTKKVAAELNRRFYSLLGLKSANILRRRAGA